MRSILLVFVSFVALTLNALESVPSSFAAASSFGVLAGTAVTCTDSTVAGDVGVWPGTAVTQTSCSVSGTVHSGDGVAKQAWTNVSTTWNELALLNSCDAAHTLTGTLAGTVLSPGVYCVDAVAKTGQLILDGHGDAKATWLFLVDGALTGTSFNVVALNSANGCNVTWWAKAAATLTSSTFLGTILAGAAITITGGTIEGSALATSAATLTGTHVNICQHVTQCPATDKLACSSW